MKGKKRKIVRENRVTKMGAKVNKKTHSHLEALRNTQGIWRDRKIDALDYITSLRNEWD